MPATAPAPTQAAEVKADWFRQAIDKMSLEERIDALGFLSELAEQIATPIRDSLKEDMEPKERCESAFFEALRSEMRVETVDTRKFVQRWKEGKMTEAEFVACIKVNVTPARTLLPQDAFERMRHRPRFGTPVVKVERRKGVSVELGNAVAALGKMVQVKARAEAV